MKGIVNPIISVSGLPEVMLLLGSFECTVLNSKPRTFSQNSNHFYFLKFNI